MINDEFKLYRTKYLFLLVGENPLPNYVAAKLLLDPGGTLYLIHSASTDIQAVRLAKVLKSERIKSERVLLDDESDAYRIKQKVSDRLEKLEDGSVGLHYSGGTKPMAVHVYRSLIEKSGERQTTTIFSYLDSRRIQLCIDQPNDDTVRIPITHQNLSVSLETIFHLHRGLAAQQKSSQVPNLPDVATVLAELVSNQETAKKWFDWFLTEFCNGSGELEAAARNSKKSSGKPGNWKSKTDLSSLAFQTDSIPPTIAKAFKNLGYVTPDSYLSLAETAKSDKFKTAQEFCKWLDGLWLEHYVLQQVSIVAEKKQTIDHGMNFNFKLENTKFEFDVAFTYGYQLFAISCTTLGDQNGQRGSCKLKLIEAYIRAQQMGGTESRVALVCLADDPGSIRNELSDFLEKRRVKVFGRKHLLTLADEIEQWICEELNR